MDYAKFDRVQSPNTKGTVQKSRVELEGYHFQGYLNPTPEVSVFVRCSPGGQNQSSLENGTYNLNNLTNQYEKLQQPSSKIKRCSICSRKIRLADGRKGHSDSKGDEKLHNRYICRMSSEVTVYRYARVGAIVAAADSTTGKTRNKSSVPRNGCSAKNRSKKNGNETVSSSADERVEGQRRARSKSGYNLRNKGSG